MRMSKWVPYCMFRSKGKEMEKAKETRVLSPTIVCSFTITGFLPEISITTARS